MEFKIEAQNESLYENGIHFFEQNTAAFSVAAEAHIHEAIEIIFITSGSFTVQTDSGKYKAFANDMILFRSNTIHSIFTGKDSRNSYHVLKIKPTVIRDLAPPSESGAYLLNFIFNRDGAKCVWRAEELKKLPEITDGFEAVKQEAPKTAPYSDMAVRLAAGKILLGILRSSPESGLERIPEASGRTADCIYKAMAYINVHYDGDLTESDVSSAVGLSYHYFSRTFRLITGKSFKEYLNITRTNHAERLLVTTDKTVSEISTDCGYNDVSYFIRVYKKYKHFSPGTIRSSASGTHSRSAGEYIAQNHGS